MLTITICVGSSCHVRGSDEVAATFERLIQDDSLSAQIEMVGAFCMEACSMGVSVKVGDRVYRGVAPCDAEAFFRDEVLPLV
ncbi:MAG: (2Fe-2S) ferredoxin domain-containing protein [Anaerolineae bacterium]